MTDTSLAVLLDRLVRRLHVSIQLKAPSFDTHKVGPVGGFLLLTLAEKGDVSMVELAEMLVRDKGQLTREVSALESKGLVVRRQSDADLRVMLVSLNEAGQREVEVLRYMLAQTLDDVLISLSGEEKSTLQALLAKAVPPEGETAR